MIPRAHTRNRNFKVGIFRTFLAYLILAPLYVSAQYSGLVFRDINGNGRRDPGEQGLADVRVTNGEHVTVTSENGTFSLPESERDRFIYVTTPEGFLCNPFYLANRGQEVSYNFPMIPTEKRENFSFIHISDTETYDSTSWVRMLRDYASNQQPAFLMHTGDICYEKGMRFHAEFVNSKSMGLPVYYAIGNHDLVEGPYGEALYEDLFGPVYYSFDRGNTHFIVTPMLGGDFKPSYTKEDVYKWLKNDLSLVPKDKPIIIFNHDLLQNEEGFVYRVDESRAIYLEDFNLKAWVYGHWHNHITQVHQESKVVSICTSPVNKGGIDHSVAAFRRFDVNPDGSFSTNLIYSYVDHQMTIASPLPNTRRRKDGTVSLLVNAYNSTAPVAGVKYRLHEGEFHNLERGSPWAWQINVPVRESDNTQDSLYISVTGIFADSAEIVSNRYFMTHPFYDRNHASSDWAGFLQNASHHPKIKKALSPPLTLNWTTNTGAYITHCSPVVGESTVFIASFDDGDIRNNTISAIDLSTGHIIWKYPTKNGVKHAIAYAYGRVFATDQQGFVYALDAKTGKLVWEKSLEKGYLPTYVGGITQADSILYTGDGFAFSALRWEDGTTVWTNKEWPARMGGPAPPTVADDVIIASSNWNRLYAFEKTTGKPLWSQSDDGLRFRNSSPVFFRGSIYGASQKSLFKINPTSGDVELKKEVPYSMQAASSPAFFKNLMIIGTADAGLKAFRAEDFSEVWSFNPKPAITTSVPYAGPFQKTVSSSPVLVNDLVYIGTPDGFLYAIDARTGKEIWSSKIGAPIYSTVAIASGQLLVADFGGNVYSFESIK